MADRARSGPIIGFPADSRRQCGYLHGVGAVGGELVLAIWRAHTFAKGGAIGPPWTADPPIVAVERGVSLAQHHGHSGNVSSTQRFGEQNNDYRSSETGASAPQVGSVRMAEDGQFPLPCHLVGLIHHGRRTKYAVHSR